MLTVNPFINQRRSFPQSRPQRRSLARMRVILTVGSVGTALLLTSCAAPTQSNSESDVRTSGEQHSVYVRNCGEDVEFQAPAERMFINDSNLVSIALAAGAGPHISAITIDNDIDLLTTIYGDAFTSLKVVADTPNMELAVANNADVVFAGWSYGFTDDSGFTPDALAERGIDSYILSESCRSSDTTRGTMDPWLALTTDLHNLGEIAGDPEKAGALIDEIDQRRQALKQAPQAEKKPTVFLFDSGTDTVFTSGSFGGPQAIIEAAGARNAMDGVADTWTRTGWEQIAAQAPDAFAFVDYEPQTLAEKIAVLKANPATRDLPAVREERFINIPYLMWTSSPQNIDAAEILRKGLEHYQLVPESTITPAFPVAKLGVDGNEWATP